MYSIRVVVMKEEKLIYDSDAVSKKETLQVCACARARVCVCVCVCVRASMCMYIQYD